MECVQHFNSVCVCAVFGYPWVLCTGYCMRSIRVPMGTVYWILYVQYLGTHGYCVLCTVCAVFGYPWVLCTGCCMYSIYLGTHGYCVLDTVCAVFGYPCTFVHTNVMYVLRLMRLMTSYCIHMYVRTYIHTMFPYKYL